MAVIWHLYEAEGNSDPQVFATEGLARRAAMSALKAEFREESRWEPSSSRSGGYDLMIRMYGSKGKFSRVCTIAPAPVQG